MHFASYTYTGLPAGSRYEASGLPRLVSSSRGTGPLNKPPTTAEGQTAALIERISKEPRNTQLYEQLAKHLLQHDQRDAAQRALLVAITRFRSRKFLAKMHALLKRLDLPELLPYATMQPPPLPGQKAKKAAKAASVPTAPTKPKKSTTFKALAKTKAKAGDRAGARKAAVAAFEQPNNAGEQHYLAGKFLSELRLPHEAVAEFEVALQLAVSGKVRPSVAQRLKAKCEKALASLRFQIRHMTAPTKVQ